MTYQVWVEGELGQDWADRLGGPAISREADGITLLTCAMPDQAAQAGPLRRLPDQGVPLVSINRIEDRRLS